MFKGTIPTNGEVRRLGINRGARFFFVIRYCLTNYVVVAFLLFFFAIFAFVGFFVSFLQISSSILEYQKCH